MYMGERFDASPMATPPRIRQAMKMENVGASALPMEVTAKSKAERIKQPFAAPPVAQGAGDQRARQTAHQRAAVGPADQRRVMDLKISLEKRFGAADDHPIPSEEQSAHRGHYGNEPDVAEVVVRLDVQSLAFGGP